MITCDDVDSLIPFVVERTFVDLGRLKVSIDRREPETTPIYFKSQFMPVDDERRDQQLKFEEMLLGTHLFEDGARQPKWSVVKAKLPSM